MIRLVQILLGALLATGCGGAQVDAPADVPHARPALPTGRAEIGIAHVAGTYAPNQSRDSFLLEGAEQIQKLGARTIKVYLTPDYREKYRENWGAPVRSLVELAQTRQFSSLFAMPFDTFVITTYSFAMGTGDPWRDGAAPELLAAEAREFEALTEYLLRTYVQSGKTFILQNWEGDWSLLGGYDATAAIPLERVDRMAQWLKNRQMAVERARAQVGEDGVTVLHAIEVNRVLDSEGRIRVVNSVLPKLRPDLVSYSSWEALELPAGASVETAANHVRSQLRRAVGILRSNLAPAVPIYFGELGFAEAELATAQINDTSPLIEAVVTEADELQVSFVIYWQVFDNECQGAGTGCRGFWVIRPDGSLSGPGRALQGMMLPSVRT